MRPRTLQISFFVLLFTVCASWRAHAGLIIVPTPASSNSASGGTGFLLNQSFTTPVGGPWNNIAFSWLTTGNTSFADGQLHISTTAFTTTYSDAANHSGVFGSASDAGSTYNFPSAMTLSPSTQYFVAMDGGEAATSLSTLFDEPGSGGGVNFGGGALMGTNLTVAHTVTGSAVPEPSAFLCIGLVGLGWAGWMRLKRCRRKS